MDNLNNFNNLNLLKQLVESFWQAYFFYHINQKQFLLLSPATEQVLGISTSVLQDNPAAVLPIVHPEDKEFMLAHYQKLTSEEGPQKLEQMEFRVIMPDQQNYKWVLLAARIFKENNETYIGGYLEDITKRKEYLYNILKFNAKKNSTLEILSHDLAAPFANIEGLASLMEHQLGDGNKEVVDTLVHIKENAKRGSDMIRDFVDNEFLETSQVILHKERIDIVLRAKVLMDNYRQQQDLVSKQFGLEAPSKPVFVYVDEMKFMQVLNNLISNAIKFTQDNGRITLRVEDRNDTVFIAVSDDGIGIPEALQPYLFDKFTKARRVGLRGEKSVGLGMSIIRNIVEWHHGKIWFESKEDKGSTFYIEIPKESSGSTALH